MMGIITQLTESRLLTSKTSFRKYTGRQIAELAYLHIIGLRIIASEDETFSHAREYATKTRRDHFHKWHQNGTDLYILLYALIENDDELKLSPTNMKYIGELTIEEKKITEWLNAIVSRNGMSETYARRLFLLMDKQFDIRDSTMKSIRRLAMNWPELDHRDRSLTLTRLLQMMRNRCRQSDLLDDLEKLAKADHLEIKDVCNLETGVGCGQSNANTPNAMTLARISTLNRSRVEEDDGGAVATTSSDIAPLVKPLGAVRRRSK